MTSEVPFQSKAFYDSKYLECQATQLFWIRKVKGNALNTQLPEQDLEKSHFPLQLKSLQVHSVCSTHALATIKPYISILHSTEYCRATCSQSLRELSIPAHIPYKMVPVTITRSPTLYPCDSYVTVSPHPP